MFGYLRPLIPELKVSEYRRYLAHYCGLCRALRLRCGQAARLTLTYDMALLSMLLSDLAGEEERIGGRRCAVRPFRKHPVAEPGAAARYCADLGVLLAQRKSADGWRDERAMGAGAAAAGLSGMAKAAACRLGAAAVRVDERLAALRGLERSRCPAADEPAEVFGELMESAVCACPGLPGAALEPLAWMARQTGRWLYLVDALDDMERDRGTGSYNPLLLHGEGPRDAVRLAAEACRWAAGQAAAALDLLPLRWSGPVMGNVVYAGMPARLQAVTKEGNAANG